jgi:hypothetical protein
VSGAPRRSLKASQTGSVKRLLNAAPVGFDILSVLKANDEVQSREDFQDRGAVRSGLMDANFSDVGTQRAPGVELQRQQPPNSTAFARLGSMQHLLFFFAQRRVSGSASAMSNGIGSQLH